MSNLLLNSDDFGDKIYNRFPTKYKEDDVFNNYALKRYIQTAGEGGFKYSIEELNGLLDLKDKSNTPPEVLKLLAQELGFQYFNGIPEAYLRYLIPRIPEIWGKKGTLDVVDYAISIISGIQTTKRITYDEHGNPIINVYLEMDISLDSSYFPSAEQLNRIIAEFIPFSMDSVLVYAYAIFESATLRGSDRYFFDNVTDSKEDTGHIGGFEEIAEDEVSYYTTDNTEFITEETWVDTLILKPIEDAGGVIFRDSSAKEEIVWVIDESYALVGEETEAHLGVSYAPVYDEGAFDSSETSPYILFTCSPLSTLNNAPLGLPNAWDKVNKNGILYSNYPSEYNITL